jgi:hypothetical protein
MQLTIQSQSSISILLYNNNSTNMNQNIARFKWIFDIYFDMKWINTPKWHLNLISFSWK